MTDKDLTLMEAWIQTLKEKPVKNIMHWIEDKEINSHPSKET